MRCFSRRCSFADNRSRSRPLADVGYEWHLRTYLRFDQHIITFYRAGSDRRIITGNGTFRHVTGGRQSLHIARWPPPPTLGRPHSARDAAKQQIACRRNRTQHDGRHRNQRHTGYGSRTFIGIRESKQTNVSQSVSHHPFLSDSRPSDALRQCFHGMFHMSRLPVPETEDPHIAHTPASPHRANARHRR